MKHRFADASFDLLRKMLNTIQNKVGNRESGSLEITSKLFVCPKCGKQSFSIHRKTYENIVIAFAIIAILILHLNPQEKQIMT